MQKIYRILRNNREQGPFSLEELVQLSLQPSDLVWQDGRSAAWRYPSEIELLKPYVSPDTTEPATKARAAFVSYPSQSNNEREEVITGEILTEEKLQQKADEIFNRVQSYKQQEKEVETKYARSLDDLKQEYVDWLQKSKRKKTFPLNKNIIIAAAAVLILFSLAFLLLVEGKKNTIPQPEVKTSKSNIEKLNSIQNERVKPVVEKKKSSVDEFIDSVREVLARQDAEMKTYQPYLRKPVLKSHRPVENKRPAAIAASIPPEKKPLSEMVDMNARYIASENGRNLELLEVTISNNSAEQLQQVTVDVFYYKRGKRLFDKETLYFNNISPGISYTVSRPANAKAVEARFKLGTVRPMED
jgi:hypothetical protein